MRALSQDLMPVVQGLVTALQGGEGAGKQRAALLLWQMLHVPAAVGTSAVVASQCASSDALVPGISWALHAESSAAAGVVQALVHDNHRWAAASTGDEPCSKCVPGQAPQVRGSGRQET